MNKAENPNPMNPTYREVAQNAIKELVRKHQIACEELTEAQMAETIRQALACGDLKRHVRVTDNAQAVVYAPYAETQRLSSRIERLEKLLKQNGIEEPNERDD